MLCEWQTTICKLIIVFIVTIIRMSWVIILLFLFFFVVRYLCFSQIHISNFIIYWIVQFVSVRLCEKYHPISCGLISHNLSSNPVASFKALPRQHQVQGLFLHTPKMYFIRKNIAKTIVGLRSYPIYSLRC